MPPAASIIVPTRSRPDYLEVTLASIAPQALARGAEVIVADDGGLDANRAIAEAHGARYLAHASPQGPNAARNTGIEAAAADLVVLVDDDVEAPEGWLAALLDGVDAAPGIDVFGGPISARFEGLARARRTCGREGPPITFLDLGPRDADADFVWSANMAIRRAALERVGPFDAGLEIYGDEEEWQRRHKAAGGRIRYLAAAGLDHRRAGADATPRALARAARARGRNSRRYDQRKGTAPPLAAELRTLAACAVHGPLRRCANGVPLTAAAWGRVSEALREKKGSDPVFSGPDEPFLSGTRGGAGGRRAVACDALTDGLLLARAIPYRLGRAAERFPPRRRVLVLGVERPDVENLMDRTRAELARSRHDVEIRTAVVGERGKFENLNALLGEHGVAGRDWVLVVDDDVALGPGFLDRLLFLAERFDLDLAQPAHRHRSHAAWELTRRRPGALVRVTAFVEIGPVVALRATTFSQLLPFPDLRMGWGLDAHWAAVARASGWRMGIVDALPVTHLLRPVAGDYPTDDAIAEARAFLAERPHLGREESQRTLAVHARW